MGIINEITRGQIILNMGLRKEMV